MVHALAEVHRTLKPGSPLLDLRPFLPFGPLELVHGGEARALGRLDETDFDPGDVAADEAIGEVCRRGLFILEAADTFRYGAYWDSVEELREYLKDWQETAHLPRRLAGEARRALKTVGAGARLRLQTVMVVNRLRRFG